MARCQNQRHVSINDLEASKQMPLCGYSAANPHKTHTNHTDLPRYLVNEPDTKGSRTVRIYRTHHPVQISPERE